MNLKKLFVALGIASSLGLFSACDMMSNFYDDTLDSVPSSDTQSGQNSSQQTDSVTRTDSTGQKQVIQVKSGQYYIDASSYTKWVYINFHSDSLCITTSDISLDNLKETGAPQAWDIAQHRYDVKTNQACVFMTDYHSISDLEAAGLPADAAWVADEYSDNAITVDMSHMLEGYLVYAPGNRNTEAGRWLHVDTSSMPPSYTLHDNVMLYRFDDGTYAAIQLVNFMSTDKYQIKGWMTVNYQYPIFVK